MRPYVDVSLKPHRWGPSEGRLGESDVKKRQNKLNKDKDSNGGLQSVTPPTLWCVFLQKEFTIKYIFWCRRMILGFYSLRHCSQSRKSGLYGSVRCSGLHRDFLPELFWVKEANSGLRTFSLFSTNNRETVKDTLSPDLCQPFNLARAARECLCDHEEQVSVFYAFCVEQPVERQWWIFIPLRSPCSAGSGASIKFCWRSREHTVSSFHSPAARCRSWWCWWSRTDSGWWRSCFPSSRNLPREHHLQQNRFQVVRVVPIYSSIQE